MILQKRRVPVVSLTLTIIFTSFAVAVYINRFDLMDWWQLRSYVAPNSVATLAAQTTMNKQGKKLFYVNKPAIQEKEAFNSSCRENEQTIVLGCYVQNRGIYVLNVTDVRLDGVEQVTAAHEMLHAAYQRLSLSEKTRINNLVTVAYSSLTDQRIKDNIAAYQAAKADVSNELHSILGTEVSKLPPELETYYKQYFTDRSKIVAYSEKYETELTSRKNKIVADDKVLTDLEPKITANNDRLDPLHAELQAQKDRLTALRNAGDYTAYNAGVGPYNAKISSYNSIINQTNDMIAKYRSILSERNGLAQDLTTLTKALDSRITTRNQL